MGIELLLLILLVVFLVGGFPLYRSGRVGAGSFGGVLGVILLVLLALFLFGRI